MYDWLMQKKLCFKGNLSRQIYITGYIEYDIMVYSILPYEIKCKWSE